VNVKQLQSYCRGLPGASERLLPEPYNILVYEIHDQTFAYFKTSEPERWRFSIRVSPMRFVELTDQPGVKPTRWRGRYHWITIVAVANFPADYLRELVMASHERARQKLPLSRRPACAGPLDEPT